MQGMINLNRAVDGDTVAIEMLPKSEWSCPSSLVLVDREERQKEEDDIDENVGCCSVCLFMFFCVFLLRTNNSETTLLPVFWEMAESTKMFCTVWFLKVFFCVCLCLFSLNIVVGLGFVCVHDKCDDDGDEDDCDNKPRILGLHFLKPIT